MNNPLISLIIPTRERADTLFFSIKAALEQKTDNYEILIADNFSSDNTKDIVEMFNDPRIVYINSGKRLSMCDNFEFALNHAKGEYLIFIGDDDGVIPGSIDKLEKTIINNKKYSIFCWPKPIYIWPKGRQKAYVWSFSFGDKAYDFDIRKRANMVIKWGGTGCGFLPAIYHCAIEKKVLEMIKEKTGRVFHSTMPDIFTAFSLPIFIEKAYNIGYLVTITGQSPKSNSVISFDNGGLPNVKRFLAEYGDYKIHKSLYPGLDTVGNLMPDTILVAMDKFPEFYHNIKFNYNAMWSRLLQSSNDYNLNLSIKKIISMRKEIRKYHNFNVPKFVFYCMFWRLPEFYRKMIHKKTQAGLFGKDAPDNVYDFGIKISNYLNK